MRDVRQQLVEAVYHHFEQWLAGCALALACRQGCATCCTGMVHITAAEGELIHAYASARKMNGLLADRLNRHQGRPLQRSTTNEFAQQCLAGAAAEEEVLAAGQAASCPFLEDGSCLIYPVRPFACRSMASLITCQAGTSAELPPAYVTATMVGHQLIEHIGQGDYWGNLFDVLLALCDQRQNQATASCLTASSLADQGRARLKKARPLPGFLIGPDDYEQVRPFIEAVFGHRIGEKRVEDILNGK